jgi:hypothetical protein
MWINYIPSPLGDCVIMGDVVIPNECEESYIIDFIILEDFSDSLEMTKHGL